MNRTQAPYKVRSAMGWIRVDDETLAQLYQAGMLHLAHGYSPHGTISAWLSVQQVPNTRGTCRSMYEEVWPGDLRDLAHARAIARG